MLVYMFCYSKDSVYPQRTFVLPRMFVCYLFIYFIFIFNFYFCLQKILHVIFCIICPAIFWYRNVTVWIQSYALLNRNNSLHIYSKHFLWNASSIEWEGKMENDCLSNLNYCLYAWEQLNSRKLWVDLMGFHLLEITIMIILNGC